MKQLDSYSKIYVEEDRTQNSQGDFKENYGW
jgi:hypothetical protein